LKKNGAKDLTAVVTKCFDLFTFPEPSCNVWFRSAEPERSCQHYGFEPAGGKFFA